MHDQGERDYLMKRVVVARRRKGTIPKRESSRAHHTSSSRKNLIAGLFRDSKVDISGLDDRRPGHANSSWNKIRPGGRWKYYR